MDLKKKKKNIGASLIIGGAQAKFPSQLEN